MQREITSHAGKMLLPDLFLHLLSLLNSGVPLLSELENKSFTSNQYIFVKVACIVNMTHKVDENIIGNSIVQNYGFHYNSFTPVYNVFTSYSFSLPSLVTFLLVPFSPPTVHHRLSYFFNLDFCIWKSFLFQMTQILFRI